MSATALHMKQISVHAPTSILFTKKSNIDAAELPISPTILRTEEFRTFFDIYYNDIFDDTAPPPQQLSTLNLIIRTASMKARQAIQGHKDIKGLYRPELYFTLARVVWNNDTSLARLLCTCSNIAAEHLSIVDDKNNT